MKLTSEILSMFRKCEEDYKYAHVPCYSLFPDGKYQEAVNKYMKLYQKAYG